MPLPHELLGVEEETAVVGDVEAFMDYLERGQSYEDWKDRILQSARWIAQDFGPISEELVDEMLLPPGSEQLNQPPPYVSTDRPSPSVQVSPQEQVVREDSIDTRLDRLSHRIGLACEFAINAGKTHLRDLGWLLVDKLAAIDGPEAVETAYAEYTESQNNVRESVGRIISGNHPMFP